MFTYSDNTIYGFRLKDNHLSSLETGFSCPNNPLNMYAFMHEKLPKYAYKSSTPNIKIDFTLF
jgi:hypothetical protein